MKRVLIFIGGLFVIAIGAISIYGWGTVRDFAWGVQRGINHQASVGPNGLPLCNEPAVIALAERAIQQGPTAKTLNINFFSVENATYAEEPKATDKKTKCKADAVTNGGKATLSYTLEPFTGGQIYVQAVLTPVGDGDTN